jgi:hypothetical protein
VEVVKLPFLFPVVEVVKLPFLFPVVDVVKIPFRSSEHLVKWDSVKINTGSLT